MQIVSLVTPIERCLSMVEHLGLRKQLSTLETLKLIQKRISFFSIYTIFESQLIDELAKKETTTRFDFMKERLENIEQTLHLVV